MSSALIHWYIDATVFKNRVEEIHLINEPNRNLRRQRHKVIWDIERVLGCGGFGEVRLEKNKDGKARAVKRIPTVGMVLSNSDWEKEMEALLEFSKHKVGHTKPHSALEPVR
jgi:calcium/calmodulin-dependent protein kinase I